MEELIIVCQPQHLLSLERMTQELLHAHNITVGETWAGRSCKWQEGNIVLAYTGSLPESFLDWLEADSRVDDYFGPGLESARAHKDDVKIKPVKNDKLKQAREQKGFSQAEVAEAVGTDPLSISRWERGISRPFPHFRQKLCAFFGKSPEELGLLREHRAG